MFVIVLYSFDLFTEDMYLFQLFTTITVDEPAPGLKTILSFRLPDQRSGKVSNDIRKYL